MIKYFLLALIVYFPLFGHLDKLPIRIWDESRLSINAYEMQKNGNLMVPHFEGSPDMWNTKPPFMLWCQALLMKVMGVSELSMRLPSAIAAFLTCVLLMWFAIKYLGNFWFGCATVMVLITTNGYVDIHVTRTGDYDAMLILFATLSGLAFFTYCENGKSKFLYLFFAALVMAVLTKGVTVLMFGPGLALYAILRKKFLQVLRSKEFYFGLVAFIMVVGGYYLLREQLNPGYLKAVYDNELGGRFASTIEEHKHGFWYYFNLIIGSHLTYWFMLSIAGIVMGLLSTNSKISRLTWFATMMTFSFLIIISLAETKLQWYHTPVFPYTALLAAIALFHLSGFLQKVFKVRASFLKKAIPYIFLLLISFIPYMMIFKKTYLPKEPDGNFYDLSKYLRHALQGKTDLHGYYVLSGDYQPHVQFYMNILRDRGVDISFRSWETLESGHKVMAVQDYVKEYIESHYVKEITGIFGNVFIYEIYGRK